MFNSYNFMVPERVKTWRSAYEIEIAALEYEKKWQQMHFEEAQSREKHGTGFWSFLKMPLAWLAG